MKNSILGFLALAAVATCALGSFVVGIAIASAVLLAWPTVAVRLLDSTPRSIFQTRRAGLA